MAVLSHKLLVLCALLSWTASVFAQPALTAHPWTQTTHVGIPVTIQGSNLFTYTGSNQIEVRLGNINPNVGMAYVTGGSVVFTPLNTGYPAASDGSSTSFEFYVYAGSDGQASNTITVIQKQYLCEHECPMLNRWKTTPYYIPAVWSPNMLQENDVTLDWENNGLVLRMIGWVGDGGQQFGGFKEFKFNPNIRPFFRSSYAQGNDDLTFQKSCLDNKAWPNQFTFPTDNMCTGNLNTAYLCQNAPLFAMNRMWQLEWGSGNTPCQYKMTSRYAFANFMPGLSTTSIHDDNVPLWATSHEGDTLTVTSNFYNQAVQPNNPRDESRGWQDYNYKYLLKARLNMNFETSMDTNIFTCDPKCETDEGGLHCQDLCSPPSCTTNCPPPPPPSPSCTNPPCGPCLEPPCEQNPPCTPGSITDVSVALSTFDAEGQTRTTVTYHTYEDGSFVFDIRIDTSAAEPETGSYLGKVILKVCVCGFQCSTYTRNINLLLSTYSLVGGFVGTVRTCRANPLVQNPMDNAADICEEVDALTYGPPDRATIFFDIKDVETEYVDPVYVEARFSANGQTIREAFRDQPTASPPTNNLPHMGYYELTRARRESCSPYIGDSDFAFTILPGVYNDNFKIRLYVTLKIWTTRCAACVADTNFGRPAPTNPWVTPAPGSRKRVKRFRQLADADSQGKMTATASLNVQQNFDSAKLSTMRTKVGMQPGTRQFVDMSTGRAEPSNANSASLLIAGAVCGVAVVVLVVAIAGLTYWKRRSAANAMARVNSSVEKTELEAKAEAK